MQVVGEVVLHSGSRCTLSAFGVQFWLGDGGEKSCRPLLRAHPGGGYREQSQLQPKTGQGL